MTAPEYPPLKTFSTGIRRRCPRRGKGPLLKGYLTIRDSCPACGLDYGFAEPADGPARRRLALALNQKPRGRRNLGPPGRFPSSLVGRSGDETMKKTIAAAIAGLALVGSQALAQTAAAPRVADRLGAASGEANELAGGVPAGLIFAAATVLGFWFVSEVNDDDSESD